MGTVSNHNILSLSPPPVSPPRAPIPVERGGGGPCSFLHKPGECFPITGTVGRASHSFCVVTAEHASGAPVPTAGALRGAS